MLQWYRARAHCVAVYLVEARQTTGPKLASNPWCNQKLVGNYWLFFAWKQFVLVMFLAQSIFHWSIDTIIKLVKCNFKSTSCNCKILKIGQDHGLSLQVENLQHISVVTVILWFVINAAFFFVPAHTLPIHQILSI